MSYLCLSQKSAQHADVKSLSKSALQALFYLNNKNHISEFFQNCQFPPVILSYLPYKPPKNIIRCTISIV